MGSNAAEITTEKFKKLLSELSESAPNSKQKNVVVDRNDTIQLQNLIRQIPTYEIKEGTIIGGSNYRIGGLLGTGTYGKVYSATRNGEEFAVKVKKNISKQQKDDNLFERQIMKKITELCVSEWLVGALGTVVHGPNYCYIMQKLDISVHEFLLMNEQNRLQVQVVVSIAQQLCNATKTLLEIGFLHLDIKPANILFCNTQDTRDRWKIKLCDFGLSLPSQLISNYFGSVQTINYRAPEVLLGLPKCEKVDCWSIGCVIFSLYTGSEIFTAMDEFEMLRQIESVTGLPDGYENGIFINKYYTVNKTGVRILRDNSKTVVYARNYSQKGFDGLEKIGNNYLTSGFTTQMDISIVTMIKSLLHPTAHKRMNASQARVYLESLTQNESDQRTNG